MKQTFIRLGLFALLAGVAFADHQSVSLRQDRKKMSYLKAGLSGIQGAYNHAKHAVRSVSPVPIGYSDEELKTQFHVVNIEEKEWRMGLEFEFGGWIIGTDKVEKDYHGEEVIGTPPLEGTGYKGFVVEGDAPATWGKKGWNVAEIVTGPVQGDGKAVHALLARLKQLKESLEQSCEKDGGDSDTPTSLANAVEVYNKAESDDQWKLSEKVDGLEYKLTGSRNGCGAGAGNRHINTGMTIKKYLDGPSFISEGQRLCIAAAKEFVEANDGLEKMNAQTKEMVTAAAAVYCSVVAGRTCLSFGNNNGDLDTTQYKMQFKCMPKMAASDLVRNLETKADRKSLKAWFKNGGMDGFEDKIWGVVEGPCSKGKSADYSLADQDTADEFKLGIKVGKAPDANTEEYKKWKFGKFAEAYLAKSFGDADAEPWTRPSLTHMNTAREDGDWYGFGVRDKRPKESKQTTCMGAAPKFPYPLFKINGETAFVMECRTNDDVARDIHYTGPEGLPNIQKVTNAVNKMKEDMIGGEDEVHEDSEDDSGRFTPPLGGLLFGKKKPSPLSNQKGLLAEIRGRGDKGDDDSGSETETETETKTETQSDSGNSKNQICERLRKYTAESFQSDDGPGGKTKWGKEGQKKAQEACVAWTLANTMAKEKHQGDVSGTMKLRKLCPEKSYKWKDLTSDEKADIAKTLSTQFGKISGFWTKTCAILEGGSGDN